MEIRPYFASVASSYTVEQLNLVAEFLRDCSFHDFLDRQRMQDSLAPAGERKAVTARMNFTNGLASEIEQYVSSLSEGEN